jgi:hypothetical protein
VCSFPALRTEDHWTVRSLQLEDVHIPSISEMALCWIIIRDDRFVKYCRLRMCVHELMKRSR